MANLGQTLQQLKAMKAMSQTQGRASPAEILRSVDAFGTNPGALRMKMYAPQTLEAGAALVVVLHGCTQTASGYAGPAGWLALAARYNFVIVAPEQRRENNPNLCFNWFEPGDIKRAGGEAQSIAEMVRYAVNKHQLDPGRVFVTGLSAGGAMTCVMLATYPELFAGGAVVAGLAYGSAKSVTDAFAAMSASVTPDAAELAQRVRRATDHPGPWPKVAVWHGAADQIVRPAAGEAVAAQW